MAEREEKTTRVALSSLVVDFALYPRTQVDSQHVHYMRQALAAGVVLPPIIIHRVSRRIIDGVHRYRSHLAEDGPDGEAEVIEKDYASEAEMFLDAIRYNASHGRSLTTHDRTRCLLEAKRFRIGMEKLSEVMGMSVKTLKDMGAGRVSHLTAKANGVQKDIPLKRTIRHMAGKSLTPEQCEVNDKLSGMEQAFYVNQLILLIESELLDRDDERLMERLRHLHGLLDTGLDASGSVA